jgi:hypothetical protein
MTHPNPWQASLWTYERVIARPMRRVTVGHGRGERVDKHLLIRRWLDQIPRRAATAASSARVRTSSCANT